MLQPYCQTNLTTLFCGNCLDVLATLPEASVDYVITDPPYLLDFMEKEWDSSGGDISTNEVVFRSWFAGLVAGEGCFRIHRQHEGGSHTCVFSIKMRADEGPLLRALARRTGAGVVHDVPPQSGVIESGPGVLWVVQSRGDCWKIAHLLDGTPLYAKKQREYDLWRRALKIWTENPRGNRWTGPSDQSQLAALWEEMKSLRPFDQELADSHFDPFRQPDYLFHNRWAKACLRVVKPGGFLLTFGGTRTYHKLVCAIEDAGWEIRDCLMWLYGQGMPKCGDIGKMIDKSKGAKREVIGDKLDRPGYHLHEGKGDGCYGGGNGLHAPGTDARLRAAQITAPATPEAAEWTGWAMALKPAWEPIVLAMKPLDGTIAHNALTHGVAGLNIDQCRIGTDSTVRTRRDSVTDAGWSSTKRSPVGGSECGRWPANLLLDEEAAALLDAQTGVLKSGMMRPGTKRKKSRGAGSGYRGGSTQDASVNGTFGDSGGASRFFYVAKASRSERNPEGIKNDHATVKPLALMEYLLTLLSPPSGGVGLDPFAGSGTTLMAAQRLGRSFIGVELEEHHCEVAKARILQA